MKLHRRLVRWLARDEIRRLEEFVAITGGALIRAQGTNRDLRVRLDGAMHVGCPDRPSCARLAHELERLTTESRSET